MVPATGAGVKREFSKSGRVASTTLARLNPVTVEETMHMKDRIRRHGSAKEKKEFFGEDNETDRDSESVDERLDKASRDFIAAVLEKMVPKMWSR